MAHLTLEQRYRIEFCISENKNYTEIGGYIDKDKSVVSREISRNSDARNGKYRAELAETKAQERHLQKPKTFSFTDKIKFSLQK